MNCQRCKHWSQTPVANDTTVVAQLEKLRTSHSGGEEVTEVVNVLPRHQN
jgi:hypothetical protein